MNDELKVGGLAYYTGNTSAPDEVDLGPAELAPKAGIVELVAFYKAGTVVTIDGQAVTLPCDSWAYREPGQQNIHGAAAVFIRPLSQAPAGLIN
jgi:hypothetical protein